MRRDGGTAAGRPTAAGAATMRSGRLTSSRLPATSTTTVCRASAGLGASSSPSHGGMSLTNSVSIHRVNTPNVPSSAVKAGSRTTLRWNGSTVGRPATSNSSRARRARSSASARSRPVTMILPSSESNAPLTESPAVTPESRRMPGPPNVLNTWIGPGWGRNPRPGSSPLTRNSIECPIGHRIVVVERAALGDAELLAHEVDAGDLLGDGVLDLEARVDLEERDRAVGADEELARARADVADLAQDRLRRVVQDPVLLVAQERRGCLLDELLVTALQRAVAGGDHDDVARGIREALRLDVAGLVEVLLDEALAAAEGGDRLAGRGLEHLGDLVELARDLEPAPAAAVGGLDRDRQAELLGERDDLGRAGDRDRACRARAERRPSRRRGAR